MADNYLVVGKDGARTTDNPGDATVIGSSGNGPEMSNWKSLAYTAGGGALAYMLAKYLMDEDDEDGKGKKKGGFLRSITPYLAALAGAAGGYGLSIPWKGGKGKPGEFAIKADSKGNFKPDMPSGGGLYHGGAMASDVLGGAAGTRWLASKLHYKPERLREFKTRLNTQIASASGTEKHQLKEILKSVERRIANAEAARLSGSKWQKTLSILGKNRRWLPSGKASGWAALASIIPSVAGHTAGVMSNSRLRELKKHLEDQGFSFEE